AAAGAVERRRSGSGAGGGEAGRRNRRCSALEAGRDGTLAAAPAGRNACARLAGAGSGRAGPVHALVAAGAARQAESASAARPESLGGLSHLSRPAARLGTGG